MNRNTDLALMILIDLDPRIISESFGAILICVVFCNFFRTMRDSTTFQVTVFHHLFLEIVAAC